METKPAPVTGIIAFEIASHALWLHATGPRASQPERCACGHRFELGERMSVHVAEAVSAALAEAGYEIVQGYELDGTEQ